LGDTLKTQIEILILGELERAGICTMLVDWEMTPEDHASRLRRLYGADVPAITYVRAQRALVDEGDRIKRLIHEHQIGYAGFDSVGFGCAGPPEQAEHALAFMRVVRQLGIGTLLIAHQAKGENGDKTPFGSAFWFNSARVIYAVKREDSGLEDRRVNVALYPTKSNLFRRGKPIGLQFTFDDERTTVENRDVADMGGELASKLSVPLRMRAVLRRGPMTTAALAEELGVPENTITVNVTRGTKGDRRWLTKIPGTDGLYRIGLLAKEG
jgi:hypothetical protein